MILLGAAGSAGADRSVDIEVRWDPDAADAGRDVARRWPEIRRRVVERLGFDADLRGAELIVVRGHDRLREAARVDAPPWAAGVTVGTQRIVVRADAPSTALSGLETTLRHECVHLLWARRAGLRRRSVPLWFEEGVAEHVGGGVSVSAGARLDVAVGTGRLLAFDDLSRTWPSAASDADLAYQQARRWVDLVAQRTGWPTVGAVFERALASPEEDGARAFDQGVREATGRPVSLWHADWRRSLEERADGWWLWLVSDLGTVLWALLALVCAALYVLVLRARRRRQIAELPDEAPPAPPGT